MRSRSAFYFLTLSAGTLGLSTLSGCFLAPAYHRPPVEAAAGYKEQLSTGAVNSPFVPATPKDGSARGAWWLIFNDPTLNALEDKVAVSNQTLKVAEAQFREARAVVTVARADYFPTVVATPSATREHQSSTISRSNNGTGGASGATFNDFDLPVSASWEPDFWGRTTMQVRSAKASAQASAAALESVRLSMQGELAADYFSLAAVDMQEKLLQSSIVGYQQTYQLTQVRFTGGIASQTDVAQAETQLASTRAQLTDLGITRAQLEHAIAVLVGESPSVFSQAPLEIHGAVPMIPTGVPSQLLERRPDIAQAERQMVAANQLIGVARTAFFPTISLTATGGFESGRVTNWISLPSRIWSLGAAASQTLLDFGRTIGLAKEARANYDGTIANYRQTVLAAFQEVEDNLAAERLLAEESTEQAEAVRAAELSLRLQNLRYQQGVVSELDLIVVQNTALTNEIAAAKVLGRQMNAAVALIRAIGGGWDDSQLPWPSMLSEPATKKNTPIAPIGVAAQPSVTVSTETPAAILSTGTATAAPVAISSAPIATVLSTGTVPSVPVAVSSTPVIVVPATPVLSTTTATVVITSTTVIIVPPPPSVSTASAPSTR